MSSTENAGMLRSLADEVLVPLADGTRAGEPELGKPWELILDLGWPAAGVPEDLGGGGGDIGDALALAEGLGRHAVRLPLVEAQSACAALAAGGPAGLLGARLAVETNPERSALRVTREGTDLRVTGTAGRTPWARHADALLIRVSDGGRPTWLACRLPNPAVAIHPGANLAGEPRDDVRFDGLVVPASDRWQPADRSLTATGLLLRCAALTGAMAAAVGLTGRYVREREQFGRPLQAQQSVAQAVALLRAYQAAARAALAAAAWSPTEANVLAAHVDLAGYAGLVARTAHDLHGAMGITQEYGLHHLTKRLWAWPEEGVRQSAARAALGQRTAEAGVAALWDSVIS
jgi:alkylation response protein AidB-like acyl-CoA dehydrogenase